MWQRLGSIRWEWHRRISNTPYHRYRQIAAADPLLNPHYFGAGMLWNYGTRIPLAGVLSILEEGKLPKEYGYRELTRRKKDGTLRHLAEPYPPLKALQRDMLNFYLMKQPVHFAAIAYRPNLSTMNHASRHQGAKVIITADIQDFFSATNTERVWRWWRARFDSDAVADIATALTTYKGGLPQGAPTSPALSNLVNVEMDEALQRHTGHYGGRYTRYGDDMVFSWHERARPPSDFESGVRRIVQAAGYRLHPQKGYQVWRAEDEPIITGIVLKRDGSTDIPDTMKQKIKRLAQSDSAADGARLMGYLGYQQMVKSPALRRPSFWARVMGELRPPALDDDFAPSKPKAALGPTPHDEDDFDDEYDDDDDAY